jgi:hypothetical protein
LLAARTLAPRQIAAFVALARERAGERAPRWLAVGDGALRFREHLEGSGALVPPDRAALHRVDAEAICDIGSRAAAASPEQILPDYRRRPDAEIAPQSAAAVGGSRW